jgi:serine phosphatase RsbU (regulator of sigma subunit)
VRYAGGLALFAGIYLTSRYSYDLFHSLVELFGVVVAASVFSIVWNARRYFRNNYLLLIGMALLPIALIDIFHTLAYQGMNIFTGYDTNLPTQLWLVGRYLQVGAFLVAPLVLYRRGRASTYLLSFSSLALVLVTLVFTRAFPTAYVTGLGLTTFKVISEYAICALLMLALLMLNRRRRTFERGVFLLLSASIVVTVASELLFTLYVSPYGPTNLGGHLLKLVAFYLIYKAVIETALARPYSLLFRELKQSEEVLRDSEAQQRYIADVLQETLLTVPREVPGVVFGHLYQPATMAGRVGGDFYDVFALPGGDVGLMIGDVSGHGLEAAALTSVTKNTIKAFAVEGQPPSAVLSKTNLVTLQALQGSEGTSRHFVTAFYGVLDPASGLLRYSSAGHPPAIIRRQSGGTTVLECASPVIGVFEDAHYDDGTEHLHPGDLLLLYTDGLTEARVDDSHFFGEERLLDLLASDIQPGARDLPMALYAEIVQQCAATLRDDLAILAVQLAEPASIETQPVD